MVSFICDACGNSVKKSQVEKHYQNQCRNCSVLSCIDCGVDFPGDSYINHTSCITEAEKYQGHLYQAKDKENKGEVKQKEWLKHVHGASNVIQDPKLKGLLKRLSAYSNIPRKKKKFENFCKNSVNVYDSKTLDQLWELFNTKNETPSKDSDSDQKTQDNGSELSEKSSSTVTDETVLVDTPSKDSECVSNAPKKKKKKKSSNESITNDISDKSGGSEQEQKESDSNIKNCNNDDSSGVEQKIKKKKRKRGLLDTPCINTTNNLENNVSNDTNETIINGTHDVALKDKTNGKEKKQKKAKKHKINGTDVSEEIRLNPKKKKENEEEVTDQREDQPIGEDAAPLGKFHWHKAIKTVLKQSEGHEISLKKLRKKVLAAYQEHGTDHRASTMDESRALFDKKLKTYPKVKISKDIVKLVK